jgi:type IV secretion system protein VirB8
MSNEIDRPYAGRPSYVRDPAPMHSPESLAVEVWAGQTVKEAQRGRRVAWIVTGLLILICAAQAAAIAIMLPLKEVQPYTLLVDRQTGYVETVRGIRLGDLAEDEALVHAFLAQYTLARETFDPADFKDRYTRVALWSADQAQTDYLEAYEPGAPGGVLAQMRPGSLVSVMVKNIELLERDLARVRFETSRRDPGMAPVRQDFQAIMSFRFVGAPMRMEDRHLNPLGFQVMTYRRDAEVGPLISVEPEIAVSAPPEAAEVVGEGQPPPAKATPKAEVAAVSAPSPRAAPSEPKLSDPKPNAPKPIGPKPSEPTAPAVAPPPQGPQMFAPQDLSL